MSRQLPLGLELRRPTRLEDYVSADGGRVLSLLAAQREGRGEQQLYLIGPPGSGRSHLLMGQCNAARELGLAPVYLPAAERAELAPEMLEGLERFDLIAIDDVDALAADAAWERALFGLYNRARAHGRRLLFSAARAPREAGFALPDLRTRLEWGLSWRLPALDDAGLERLLHTLARRRGLELPDEVVRYLLARIPRDSGTVSRLIDRLDRDSLAEQRRLSIPFVRERLPLDQSGDGPP